MSIQAPVRVWGLSCPGSAEEVGRARRWTRDILRDCPCADDAALIVSELATNAVTHTTSEAFHITLARSDTVLAIAVTDTGGTTSVPSAHHAPDDATHGRGLDMVTMLATHLETTGDEHGHTVTAELLMKPANEASQQVPSPDGPTDDQMNQHREPHPHTAPSPSVNDPYTTSVDPRHLEGAPVTRRPTRPAVTARPGYLCECTTYAPDTTNSRVTMAAFEATSPEQAVRWIRIAARTLASSLDQAAFQKAWDWIADGHQEATDALSHGEPCAFAITHQQTHVEWTARPVLFLPTAPIEPTFTRACATAYPAPIR